MMPLRMPLMMYPFDLHVVGEQFKTPTVGVKTLLGCDVFGARVAFGALVERITRNDKRHFHVLVRDFRRS